jgi:hypothetical protein
MDKIIFIDNQKVFNKWASKTYEYKINKIIENNKLFKYIDFDDLKEMNDYSNILNCKYIIFGWNMTPISKYYTTKYNYYKKYIKNLEDENCVNKHITKLLKHKKKILLTQDLHRYDYKNGINGLINYVKKNNFYAILTPYIDSINIKKIKSKTNIKILHLPHFIDENYFKKMEMKKKYDVFIYGNIDKNHYPLRNRMKDILINLNKNNKIKLLYWDKNLKNHYFKFDSKKSNIKLSEQINSSWMTLCTKSKYNFLVGKYFETSMSNSIVLGDMTKEGKKIWEDNYTHIDNSMNDIEIENIILKSLKDQNNIQKKIDIINNKIKKYYLSNFCNYLYSLITNN